MKNYGTNLWNEYLSSECAAIDTDEERRLTKIAAELHEKANATLNNEQKDAVDKFADALCDAEASFTKKAFFKGCEFATSFLLESGNFVALQNPPSQRGKVYLDLPLWGRWHELCE